jgi:O-antigen/teichoic acid export membrane protein
LLFSFKKVKVLFSFSWKLLVSALLCNIDKNIRTLIIGKSYGSDMLGFYNRGQQFPVIIGTNIDDSIQSVLFPVFSTHQDNLEKVKNIMRRGIMTSSFIMFPIMVGLGVVAEPLIKILLTDKWLSAVPFLQIYCAVEALIPIQTSNQQAIKALGRSDIFLKLEIIKTTIGIVILGISIPFGIYAVVWGVLLSSVIATFIYAYPNSILLNYGYIEQCKDIIPSLIISLVMGAIIYPLSFLSIVVWQILVLQIVVGGIVYFSLGLIFKFESFSYLIATLKELV